MRKEVQILRGPPGEDPNNILAEMVKRVNF